MLPQQLSQSLGCLSFWNGRLLFPHLRVKLSFHYTHFLKQSPGLQKQIHLLLVYLFLMMLWTRSSWFRWWRAALGIVFLTGIGSLCTWLISFRSTGSLFVLFWGKHTKWIFLAFNPTVLKVVPPAERFLEVSEIECTQIKLNCCWAEVQQCEDLNFYVLLKIHVLWSCTWSPNYKCTSAKKEFSKILLHK